MWWRSVWSSPESHRARALALAAWLGCVPLVAAPRALGAEFWLSTSDSLSAGPERLVTEAKIGAPLTLFVWGRPTPGRVLRSLSLHLVADAPGLDLLDGTFHFRNDAGGGDARFEYTRDSSTAPALTSEESSAGAATGADAIYNANAFTLFPDSNIRGVTPACLPGEPGCVVASDGQAARPLLELSVAGVTAGAVVQLWLQLGDLGLAEYEPASGDYDYNGYVDDLDHGAWAAAYGASGPSPGDGNGDLAVSAADYTVWRDHWGESGVLLGVGSVTATLGADALGGDEPVYNAAANRSVTLAGDDSDAVITVLAASPAAAVPEPGAAAIAAGAGVFGGRRRPPRRR